MRPFVLVGVTVLMLSACDDRATPEPSRAAPSSSARAEASSLAPVASSSESPPSRVDYELVATQPLPADLHGLALFAHHVAYAEGARLMLMDWRTGEWRTVLTSEYGELHLLHQHGQGEVRYLDVLDVEPGPAGEDPSSPRRVVTIDLGTGRATPVDRRPDQVVVGEFNDARYELAGGDLVARWQQPDPDLPDRAVTTTGGLVVEAVLGGGTRFVWTQSPNVSTPDPATVWTQDLIRPEPSPTLLAADGVPYDPIVGTGFAGWSDNGLRVLLVPTSGGPAVELPGRQAWGTGPAADRLLVAMAVRSGGQVSLAVYRVG